MLDSSSNCPAYKTLRKSKDENCSSLVSINYFDYENGKLHLLELARYNRVHVLGIYFLSLLFGLI